MSKNEFSYKAKLSPKDALAHLENLVGSLRKGSVFLKVGKEHLLLNLDGDPVMEFQMNASEKKGKNRVSMTLTWREAMDEEMSTQPMVITSQAPKAAIAAKKKSAAKPKAKAKPAAKKAAARPKPKPAAKKKAAAPKKKSAAKATPPQNATPATNK